MTVDALPRGTSRAGLMIFATICASLVTVIFLTNWPTYHMTILGGPLARWYYLVPGVLLIPILFAEPAFVVRFFKEPMFLWFVAYVMSGFVWILFAQDFLDDATRQANLRVWAFFFFFTLTLLLTDANRRVVAIVILGCVLLACLFNWIDVLRPHQFVPRGTFGESPGRGAGTFLNPNAAASFIIMGTIAALPFIPMRFRALVLVAAVIGIAPTSSRSGVVYAGIVLLGAIFLRLLSRAQILVMLVAVPVLIAGTSIYYDAIMTASDITRLDKIVMRLAWFEDAAEDDGSAASRKEAAAQARDMFLAKPVTGHGIGATSLASAIDEPHNMYLKLAAEQGVTGFVLYVLFIGLLYQRGRGLARRATVREERDIGNALILYAAFFAVYGIFSHNVLEEPHGILAIAFLISAAFCADRSRMAMDSFPATPRPPLAGPGRYGRILDKDSRSRLQQSVIQKRT